MILRTKSNAWPWSVLKSPLRLALVAVIVVGAWTLLSPLGAGILDRSGAKPLTDQARIDSLEQSVGTVSRDIDVITTRVRTTMQQTEEAYQERHKQLTAEIGALKERIDAQASRAGAAGPARAPSPEVKEIRTSLAELATAQTTAVASINQRIDRLEGMVATRAADAPKPPDTVRASLEPAARHIAEPATRHAAQKPMRKKKKHARKKRGDRLVTAAPAETRQEINFGPFDDLFNWLKKR